jgi:hypothetical protein
LIDRVEERGERERKREREIEREREREGGEGERPTVRTMEQFQFSALFAKFNSNSIMLRYFKCLDKNLIANNTSR